VSFESFAESTPANEKTERWKRIEAQVDRIVDRLGLPVDEAIKPLVVALKANDFGTTGSCEGHIDNGPAYPWVDIESKLAESLATDRHYGELKQKYGKWKAGIASMAPEDVAAYERLIDTMIRENAVTYRRLLDVLDEFYNVQASARHAPVVRLTIKRGPWNQSRLEPADIPFDPDGRNLSRSWSEVVKKRRLPAYREEIRRFADFLKNKYTSSP